MTNVFDELKAIHKEQKDLAGKMSSINQRAEDLKKRVVSATAVKLYANVKGLSESLKEGEVQDLWKRVCDNVVTLNQNDPEWFGKFSAAKNPFKIKFQSDDEKKFLVTLFGNCLAKEPSFIKFLSYISSKDTANNIFFRGES